ncbi:predicted protein [Uncinocarpus reesii 1704]|uniref:Uncharacterized protein n=1 Tax=Uncinocarpus reesii (strain UAMH 1704) TaxID=336963 RepID=C4JN95_UNCRE|nr:uncharacterized protein UREG_04301 [Uncinocarpus reesii 1704]EEP79455.1 predicted protein [Uncinocarpus reesii 1704]
MGTPMTYDHFRDHVDQITSDPSTGLDLRLIEKLQSELFACTDPAVSSALLVQISALFPILQEDPTPLTNLATKAATYLNFSQILSIQPPVNIVAGIKAPSPPINLLALSLLRKAGESPSDAAVVAGDPALVVSLVEIWLTSTTTAVAEAAFDVLWSLLEVDHPGKPQINGDAEKDNSRGQGLVWRRVFGDKNVYKLLFSTCNLDNAGQPGQPSKREKSVAQGRLMDFVARVGSLDWQAIITSHFPDIELGFKSNNLLEFATCHMVDTEDVLLHMTLIHFLSDLLKIGAPGIRQRGNAVGGSPIFSSPSLEFLLSSGLHRRIVDYYVEPSALDPAEAAYLSGPIMAYISQYAELYPNHLLQNPQSFLDKLLARIYQSFDMPSAQWAHGAIPSGDLNILASVPRVMLLEAGKRSLNPLLSIPSKPLNKDTLHALGRIFHGPVHGNDASRDEQSNTLEQNATSLRAEAAAARTLYFQYLNEHPGLWNNVVAAAEIVAMTDTALAAISFIKAVSSANWAVIKPGLEPESPTSSRFAVPTEDEVELLGPATQGNLPSHGAWALLVPPALTVVLPYLFKDPQTYANFVAGGRGDSESAVWRIATAKYDALVALESSLEVIGGDTGGVDDVLRTMKRRVAQGPWGNTSQVGSRVDALEL